MIIGVAIRISRIDVGPIASHLAGCMMRRHDWGLARPCRDTAHNKMDSARPSNYLIASKACGKPSWNCRVISSSPVDGVMGKNESDENIQT